MHALPNSTRFLGPWLGLIGDQFRRRVAVPSRFCHGRSGRKGGEVWGKKTTSQLRHATGD